MSNPVDDLGNVKVDFVWGNIPLQPDDQRGEATLDPELDNHVIATSGYSGFPGFETGAPFDDTIPNAVVPNLVGMNLAQVGAALTSAGLIGNQSLSTVGATSGNNGTVKSQETPAGTVVNSGTTVNYVSYNYVNQGNPIAGMRTNVIPSGWSLNSGEVVMYLLGRTTKPSVGQTIHVAGTGATDHNQNFQVLQVANNDSFNTGGTAVKLTPLQIGVTTSSSNGGTWAVV